MTDVMQTHAKKYIKYVAYSLAAFAGLVLALFGIADVRNSSSGNVTAQDDALFTIVNEAEADTTWGNDYWGLGDDGH